MIPKRTYRRQHISDGSGSTLQVVHDVEVS